jgi:hypothetical protein
MKKALISSLIALSAIVSLAQSVRADPKLAYSFAYLSVLDAKPDGQKDKKFWEYTLKWLEQDKTYPEEVAQSFCKYRSLGWSRNEALKILAHKLLERKLVDDWSESRTNAYISITVFSVVAGAMYYCPEFKN